MLRAAAVLSVVLLFILPSTVAVTGPNPRSEDLSTEDTINAVAVAAATGHVVAATDDPGSTLNNEPREDVWFIWDESGDQVTSGHADHPDCQSRLTDNCQSDATHVAVTRDGSKLVVGSDIPTSASISDDDESRVVIARPAFGTSGGFNLNATITDLEISDDGDHIAVLTAFMSGGEERAMVYYRTLSGTSVAQSGNWERFIPVAANDLDMSGDGEVVVVATDRLDSDGADDGTNYWRFTQGGSVTKNAAYGGAATAVSVSDDDPHWTVVGYATGEVALFQDVTPSAAEFVRKPSNDDVTSVHMSRDGTRYVAGDQGGRIHLFAVTPEAPVHGAFLRTVSAGSSDVEGLRFSDSATYLIYHIGSEVSMDAVRQTSLLSLWTADLPSTPSGIAMRGDGEQVVAAFGDSVRVFQASHTVDTNTPDDATMKPGAQRTFTFTVENAGNRPADMTLGAGYDPGAVVALVDPGSLTLDPGDAADVEVTVTVLDNTPPGDQTVSLNHSLAVGAEGSAAFTVTVPVVHDVRLQEGDSTSLAVEPGAAVPFEVVVHNAGNVEETATVELASATSGWLVDIDPVPVTVAPGEDETVTVTVEAPTDAAEGVTGEAKVRLQGNAGQSVTLYATVGANFDVSLDAPPGIQVVPGETATATLTVRNDGNAPDAADLAIDDSTVPSGWSVRFANGQETLESETIEGGQSSDVGLLVQAPANAGSSTTFAFRVAAVSQGDTSARDSADIIVSVQQATATETDTGTGSNQTPTPGLLLVALGLAGLAAARRDQR